MPVGNETTCPTSASVEVTPPNAFDHLVVAATLAPCGGGTLVGVPGVPGHRGQQPDHRPSLPGSGYAVSRPRCATRTDQGPALGPAGRIPVECRRQAVEADLLVDHALEQAGGKAVASPAHDPPPFGDGGQDGVDPDRVTSRTMKG